MPAGATWRLLLCAAVAEQQPPLYSLWQFPRCLLPRSRLHPTTHNDRQSCFCPSDYLSSWHALAAASGGC